MINLETDDPIDTAAYLVQRLDAAKYWPEEPDIDELKQQIQQLESSVATLANDVAHLKAAAQAAPPTVAAPEKRQSVTPPPIAVEPGPFVPLQRLEHATGTKPSALRLPDGEVIAVRSWLEVLRECCKFVLARTRGLPIPLPDKAGKKVQLIHTVRPPKGLSSVEAEYNGQPVYLYLNYDADNCVENARYMVAKLPPDSQPEEAAVASRTTIPTK